MPYLWCFFLSSLINLTAALNCEAIDHHAQVIQRDVAVVGGGSAGTHTAIRLHQLGKTVALIEQQDRLGGHTNTYVDPATKQTFDYGTFILGNTTDVRNYFDYLDVPLKNYTGESVPDEKTLYADFARRTAVRNDSADPETLKGALARYVAQLEKYPYLASGFHLPDRVPEELLIPSGDFLAKYDLGALAAQIYYVNFGVGNILAQPTLYMLKYFNLMQVTADITQMLVTEADRNLQALYDAALHRLGDGGQAFLSSRITSICRNPTGILLTMQTPTGPKTIKASKLVMAIPPKLENLQPFFDLRTDEIQAFRQFNNTYMWNAVIANTGFPADTAIRNTDPRATYDIPAMPAMYSFAPGFSGLHAVWYGSADYMSNEEAAEQMLLSARQVQTAFGYQSPEGTEPTLLKFHDHSPYGLSVCVEAIRDGFYGRLNRLQGMRDTWWTGAAWETHSASAIWQFTEREILPHLVEMPLNRDQANVLRHSHHGHSRSEPVE
ncbi:amine oxidase [Lecanosticta acicola]|uniref:Amine oxidase n=1 Tax=Lecanosticta acicola TaxID=111012 RepID=A0AAI8Z994_9PEZI|nr:amine oxidase [Lecanosticta acicola]